MRAFQLRQLIIVSDLNRDEGRRFISRRLLLAALNVLRRYPSVYARVLSLVKRAPRAYQFLRRTLGGGSWHMHTRSEVSGYTDQLVNPTADNLRDRLASADLPSLATDSGPVTVAARRLERSLLDTSRR